MRGPPNLSCPHGARHSTLRPSWRDNATRFPNWNSIWSLELGTEPPLRATIMRYALCRIVRGYATGQKYLDIRLFFIQFSCDRTRLKQGRRAAWKFVSPTKYHDECFHILYRVFYRTIFVGVFYGYNQAKVSHKRGLFTTLLRSCNENTNTLRQSYFFS